MIGLFLKQQVYQIGQEMNKATKFTVATLASMVVLWGAGVWCSGHYAEVAMTQALDALNENLERRRAGGSLNFGIKASYEQVQKSFFSQTGNIVLLPEGTDKKYRIPVEIEHGFLRLQARADFYHFLNNLLLKNGIFERDGAFASAYADVRLFPMNYSVKVKTAGSYTGAFLKAGESKFAEGSKDAKGIFSMHRSTFGEVSMILDVKNAVTPNGTIGNIYVTDLFDENSNAFGTVHAELSDMNLRNTGVDEINDLKADVVTLAGKNADSFGVQVALDVDSTKGRGQAVLSSGNFSTKALEQSGAGVGEVLASPMLLWQYFTKDEAYLTLEHLNFDVDYTSPEGQVVYGIKGQGGVTFSPSQLSLSSVNGAFSFTFENVNSQGEGVIDAIGRNIFVKNAQGYQTDIHIDNGRLSFNGK